MYIINNITNLYNFLNTKYILVLIYKIIAKTDIEPLTRTTKKPIENILTFKGNKQNAYI